MYCLPICMCVGVCALPFAFVPCLVCLCLCVCTRVRVLADSLERLWLLMAACSLRRLPFSLVHFSPLSLPFSLLLPLCPPDLPLARHHLCDLCSQGLCIPSPPPPQPPCPGSPQMPTMLQFVGLVGSLCLPTALALGCGAALRARRTVSRRGPTGPKRRGEGGV